MPKRTPDSLLDAALKRGLSNAEALEAVRKHYPHTRLTLATVNYHRNQLRRTNSKIKSDRQASKRRV